MRPVGGSGDEANQGALSARRKCRGRRLNGGIHGLVLSESAGEVEGWIYCTGVSLQDLQQQPFAFFIVILAQVESYLRISATFFESCSGNATFPEITLSRCWTFMDLRISAAPDI
jgi:hypothetical protein